MTAEDPLGVVISARDIYDELVGMRDDVRSLAQSSRTAEERQNDHESRIRSLERWRYGIPASVVAAVVAAGAAMYPSK
jgi:anti-sigma-K factor RskA